MFKEVFEKISNSEIIKTFKAFISSVVSAFKESMIKMNADEVIKEESEKTSNDNIVGMFYEKASAFVASILAKFGFKNNKIINTIAKTSAIIAGLIFMILTVYIAIKIFPKVIVFIATLFAFALILETTLAVLNMAVSSAQYTEAQ